MNRFLRCIAALALLPIGAVWATVTAIDGSTSQTARALDPFAPIVVRVTDAAGAPVAGASVAVSMDIPIGLVDAASSCDNPFGAGWACRATSDANGVARLPRFRGEFAGTYTATATARVGNVDMGSADITLNVLALHAPAAFTILSGDAQTAVIGTPLAQPFSVRLATASGTPIPNASVLFGGGSGTTAGTSLGYPYATTDASGVATWAPVSAAWGVGMQELRVLYVDYDARAFVYGNMKYLATNAQGVPELALQDLWWAGSAENGWGVSVVQHGSRSFNVLFVYDAAGKPVWYVQPGGRWSDGVGSAFSSALYHARGTPYFAYSAPALQLDRGIFDSMSLAFEGPDRGTLRTRIAGVDTTKSIVRQPFGRGDTAPLRNLGDMWWGGPQQNGWGVAIHQQGGTLFMVWFTYDAAGEPTWFVMPGGEWRDGATYAGTIYRSSGAAWMGTSYDASRFGARAVGPFTLRFQDADHATLEWQVEDRSGTLALQRQAF